MSAPSENPYSTPVIPANNQLPPGTLRTPWVAALLAWLIPGAGHFYQRRWAKGSLFFFCVMGTFLYGIFLGSSRVVYASFRPYDFHPSTVCQVGVGLPTLPAFAQYFAIRAKQAPMWDGFMAPPVIIGQEVPAEWARAQMQRGKIDGDFEEGDFVPSNNPRYMLLARYSNYNRQLLTDPYFNDYYSNQLSEWHAKYDYKYELGWLFTAVAGLLNFLVVFDAYRGPALGYRYVKPHPDASGKPDEASPPRPEPTAAAP